jgi:hypothetical protein
MKKPTFDEMAQFLRDIEASRITITPHEPAPDVWIGPVVYMASNGWELCIHMRAGHWKHIVSINPDPGPNKSREAEVWFEDYEGLPKELENYEPPQEVLWSTYGFPKIVCRTCASCGFYFSPYVDDLFVDCEDCRKKQASNKVTV